MCYIEHMPKSLNENQNLTLKQRKFVHEYIKHSGNATQAVLHSYDGISHSNASN